MCLEITQFVYWFYFNNGRLACFIDIFCQPDICHHVHIFFKFTYQEFNHRRDYLIFFSNWTSMLCAINEFTRFYVLKVKRQHRYRWLGEWLWFIDGVARWPFDSPETQYIIYFINLYVFVFIIYSFTQYRSAIIKHILNVKPTN